MVFVIPPFDDIEFEIPDNAKGGTVSITVPPLDCMKPTDVEKMNKQLEAVPEDTPAIRNPNKNATALIQHMLAYYNPKAKAAVWNLVPREVKAINDHWEKESEVGLGESLPSTDTSSDAEE